MKLSDIEMAKKIAALVHEKGGRTFFVGGYVRDLLLKQHNKDIDIEVHGISVDELENLLKTLGNCTQMGASFGVFGLRGYNLDIAMPRKEEAIGRGHKDFKVDVDPYLGTYKAAIRRDFTINALMQDVLTGEIVDHFGGVADLEQGIIRHVNAETFVEDPLRVLRGAQFAARFHYQIAEETLALCRTMDLSTLASERIMGELEKALLKSDRPSIFFSELRQMEQLSFWFPRIEALIDVPQNPVYHPEGDVWNHSMMALDNAARFREISHEPLDFMMAALMHDLGKPVCTYFEESTGKIRSVGHENQLHIVQEQLDLLTNAVRTQKYILNMVKLHMRPNQMAERAEDQVAFNRLYDSSVDPHDLLLIAKADRMGRVDPVGFTKLEALQRERLAVYEEMSARPEVMGRDLIAAGLKPGDIFSKLLNYSHDLHLQGIEKDKALEMTLLQYERIREAD